MRKLISFFYLIVHFFVHLFLYNIGEGRNGNMSCYPLIEINNKKEIINKNMNCCFVQIITNAKYSIYDLEKIVTRIERIFKDFNLYYGLSIDNSILSGYRINALFIDKQL